VKAIRVRAMGGPEQLEYGEAPLPEPGEGEARVRVHAAGISPHELSWTSTYQTRDGRDRLPSIPGHEFSGVVHALGPGASGVKVGDEVYGLCEFDRDGCDAEYVVAPAAHLAPKPFSLTHVYAAAVPLSGLTAWQALFEHANLQAGQHVLIHGAAGAVGLFAVQLAAWKKAKITATATSTNSVFLRDMGVGHVIDYGCQRFEKACKDVDVVLDTIGGETQERSWQVMRRGGTLVSTVKPPSSDQAKAHGWRGEFCFVRPDRGQLIELGKLIEAGSVRPILDAVQPLQRARKAFERALAEHVRGNVVLQVPD
jgi:NADPH:quinone reductase-like Zn-dependent oxidoreductase